MALVSIMISYWKRNVNLVITSWKSQKRQQGFVYSVYTIYSKAQNSRLFPCTTVVVAVLPKTLSENAPEAGISKNFPVFVRPSR